MTWEMGHRWGMSIIHQYVINGISAFTWQTKGDSRSKLFRVQYLGIQTGAKFYIYTPY